MKRILFYMLFVFAFSTQAQNLVEIPDSNFRKALQSLYPDCFVGDKLSTDCAAEKEWVYVPSKNINSIDGIQYFANITQLVVRDNQITFINILPDNLIYLDVSNNQIQNLPELPINLKKLICHNNKLEILPNIQSSIDTIICSYNSLTKLPSLSLNLKYLDCSYNNLNELPIQLNSLEYLLCISNKLDFLPTLPNTLKYLLCSSNRLTSVGKLPTELINLDCSKNSIDSLSELPSKLESLSIDENNLTNLPNLPKNLKGLSIAKNPIKSISTLPDDLADIDCSFTLISNLPNLPGNLKSLNCSGNHLLAIPTLPNTLEFLSCFTNNLTKLPELPSKLYRLECDANQNLNCLPFLPKTLKYLSFTNTKIRCLSNVTPQLEINVEGQGFSNIRFPICSPVNNKNGCDTYPVISGHVFYDSNKNGTKETDEFPRKGIKVFVQPSGQYTFTNNEGYYEMAVDSLKTNTISVEAPKYFSSISQTATPTFMGEHITKDFALQSTKNVKDLSATLTPITGFARPGFSLPLVFEVENLGTTIEYGTAYVDFPSDYILDSTSINSVNGNFNFTNLHPGESIKMMVYGRLSTSATLGDTLKIRGIVNIYDSATDSVYSNNISEVKMLIRGSFDPNDKQGPSYVTPQQVQNGEFIEYTIRFQNTGTDTAFTVVIADTLTSNLLPETLEMISTSHNCKTIVKGSEVYFEFRDILLPDSNTNEVKSHGYVRFKVKPKNTLKLGQSILNTASIYFDYNKPIVTNTVSTKVDEPLLTGIQTVSISSNGLAYPNPVENGRLFVSKSQGSKYKLNNMQGQPVMSGSVDEIGLDLSQLNPGIYMIEIGTNENRKVEKIVIR